jgi:hypothetical protein
VVSSRTQLFPLSSRYAPHLLLLIERVLELDNPLGGEQAPKLSRFFLVEIFPASKLG